jgi:hypothetical protein
MEGGLRGTERALREGQIGHELLPGIAGGCCDFMQVLTLIGGTLSLDSLPSGLSIEQAIDEFRDGKALFDANTFKSELRSITRPLAEQVLIRVKTGLISRYPDLLNVPNNLGEQLLDYGLNTIAYRIMPKEEHASTTKIAINAFAADIEHQSLTAYGATKISRSQLSSLLLNNYFIPAILSPIRTPARVSQVSLIISILIVIISPLTMFRIISWYRRKNRARREALNMKTQE